MNLACLKVPVWHVEVELWCWNSGEKDVLRNDSPLSPFVYMIYWFHLSAHTKKHTDPPSCFVRNVHVCVALITLVCGHCV